MSDPTGGRSLEREDIRRFYEEFKRGEPACFAEWKSIAKRFNEGDQFKMDMIYDNLREFAKARAPINDNNAFLEIERGITELLFKELQNEDEPAPRVVDLSDRWDADDVFYLFGKFISENLDIIRKWISMEELTLQKKTPEQREEVDSFMFMLNVRCARFMKRNARCEPRRGVADLLLRFRELMRDESVASITKGWRQ